MPGRIAARRPGMSRRAGLSSAGEDCRQDGMGANVDCPIEGEGAGRVCRHGSLRTELLRLGMSGRRGSDWNVEQDGIEKACRVVMKWLVPLRLGSSSRLDLRRHGMRRLVEAGGIEKACNGLSREVVRVGPVGLGQSAGNGVCLHGLSSGAGDDHVFAWLVWSRRAGLGWRVDSARLVKIEGGATWLVSLVGTGWSCRDGRARIDSSRIGQSGGIGTERRG